MRARWESSTRPLFPRAVWCGSFRHVVLGPDDPLAGGIPPKKTTRVTPRKMFSPTMPSAPRNPQDNMLLISNSKSNNKLRRHTRRYLDISDDKSSEFSYSKNENAIYRGFDTQGFEKDKDTESENHILENPDQNNQANIKSCLKHQNTYPTCEFDLVDANSQEAFFKNENFTKNPLSDRVLQWLDLAGKCGTDETKFKKIAIEEHIGLPIKLLTKKRASSVQHYKINIKPQLFEVEEPSNQPVEEVRTNDLLKTRRRSSLNQIYDFNATNPSTILPFRSKSLTPRKTALLQKVPSKRDIAIHSAGSVTPSVKKIPDDIMNDRVYENAIQRQIVETSCNAMVAKKQLHIFMPSLPPRRLLHDNESCLSTIPSEI